MKIGLMYTDRCNFQCRHCMVDSKLEHYKVADEKVINRFLEIIAYNKPDTVCIVGGEPLLFLEEIENFEIKVYPYSYGAPVTVFRGTTIGHKAVCPFPSWGRYLIPQREIDCYVGRFYRDKHNYFIRL